MQLITEMNQQAKLTYLRDNGISVEKMPNGKLKIEDPQERIEDFFIYDEPKKAIETAYSIAKSWLSD